MEKALSLRRGGFSGPVSAAAFARLKTRTV